MTQAADTAAQENAPRCNCNDETRMTLCPVHTNMENMQDSVFGSGTGPIAVDDRYLATREEQMWSGFIFNCPKCQVPAIMVNPTMGRFCMNCGQPVAVKSRFITDYINQLQNRINKG